MQNWVRFLTQFVLCTSTFGENFHLRLNNHFLQASKFFETVAAPFTKRGLLLKFLILGGGSTLAYFSATATGDVLPIVKGPQQKPKLGPRGKI
ncbi:putative photosystem I PsaH, reaction centre subunit VI, signal peptide, camelysin [Helianthus anomalus]